MSSPNYDSLGFKDIRVTLDGRVAILLINRAKQYVEFCQSFRLIQKFFVRRNSFAGSLVPELINAFELFDRDDRVSAVVVTAELTAPAYCSGVS